MDGVAEAGPESGGEMIWTHIAKPGSRWCKKKVSGRIWEAIVQQWDTIGA